MFEQIIFLFVLIISIVLHEVAHGYAALSLGDETAKDAGRLTLNPIPHIDPLGSVILPGLLILIGSSLLFGWAKPVPYNPYNLRGGKYGEAFVAASGSLLNISLAIFFGLCVRFGGGYFPLDMIVIFNLIAYVNLFLGFLNLIPVPPLDGSKVFSLLLPDKIRLSLKDTFAPLSERLSPIALLLLLFIALIFLIEPFAIFIYSLLLLITGIPLMLV